MAVLVFTTLAWHHVRMELASTFVNSVFISIGGRSFRAEPRHILTGNFDDTFMHIKNEQDVETRDIKMRKWFRVD